MKNRKAKAFLFCYKDNNLAFFEKIPSFFRQFLQNII